jgi:hypothetical protein
MISADGSMIFDQNPTFFLSDTPPVLVGTQDTLFEIGDVANDDQTRSLIALGVMGGLPALEIDRSISGTHDGICGAHSIAAFAASWIVGQTGSAVLLDPCGVAFGTPETINPVTSLHIAPVGTDYVFAGVGAVSGEVRVVDFAEMQPWFMPVPAAGSTFGSNVACRDGDCMLLSFSDQATVHAQLIGQQLISSDTFYATGPADLGAFVPLAGGYALLALQRDGLVAHLIYFPVVGSMLGQPIELQTIATSPHATLASDGVKLLHVILGTNSLSWALYDTSNTIVIESSTEVHLPAGPRNPVAGFGANNYYLTYY